MPTINASDLPREEYVFHRSPSVQLEMDDITMSDSGSQCITPERQDILGVNEARPEDLSDSHDDTDTQVEGYLSTLPFRHAVAFDLIRDMNPMMLVDVILMKYPGSVSGAFPLPPKPFVPYPHTHTFTFRNIAVNELSGCVICQEPTSHCMHKKGVEPHPFIDYLIALLYAPLYYAAHHWQSPLPYVVRVHMEHQWDLKTNKVYTLGTMNVEICFPHFMDEMAVAEFIGCMSGRVLMDRMGMWLSQASYGQPCCVFSMLRNAYRRDQMSQAMRHHVTGGLPISPIRVERTRY